MCATGFASAYGYTTSMDSQPHRKRVRHFEANGHLHELTFSCYRRRPLLTDDRWRRVLGRHLQMACESEEFGLVAFVFMPEHVHLVARPLRSTSKVSRLLARTKQPTSKAVKEALIQDGQTQLLDSLTVQERPGKICFRFWQEGPGFDRNLFSSSAIEASLDYIHANPVKRDLCKRSIDWKWSSARFYSDSVVDPHLPTLTRPDPCWFDSSGVQHEHGEHWLRGTGKAIGTS